MKNLTGEHCQESPGTSPPFFLAVVILTLASAAKVLFSH